MVKKYGYARVSTKEQNLDRQILELKKYVDERDIITDKESGKSFERTGYRVLRDTLLREGDELYVKSLDRLGRSKQQLKDELEHFRKAGVRVRILDLPTTMMEFPENESGAAMLELISELMINLLAYMAEQERLTILRRQAEGIAAAKAAGRSLGRPKTKFPSAWGEMYALWRGGSLTAVQAMDRMGLRKSTFYRLVREWEKS